MYKWLQWIADWKYIILLKFQLHSTTFEELIVLSFLFKTTLLILLFFMNFLLEIFLLFYTLQSDLWMLLKHILWDQEKILQKQISIIDFITQILPNKMSRPDDGRPICLLDKYYMYVVLGPSVVFQS